MITASKEQLGVYNNSAPILVTEDMLLQPYLGSDYNREPYLGLIDRAEIRVISNISSIKYISPDNLGLNIKVGLTSGNASYISSGVYKSMSVVRSDGTTFNYVDGMTLLKPDETGVCRLVFETESDVVPNELYTVGDRYELYYSNDKSQWEKWCALDTSNYYTKEEIDAIISSL